ncbi:hypothetical protein KIL84_011002 [Mauremys mutica]|uniref:Uncharacterized protein n=1 Tax=Mauremys mutica TaxID=74926 RepID=A0A9D4B209_9SAUR|nr:hypothetical protein KIL84_011002 [Mauremys mutica]
MDCWGGYHAQPAMRGGGGNAVKMGEGKGTGKCPEDHSPLIPPIAKQHIHILLPATEMEGTALHRWVPNTPHCKIATTTMPDIEEGWRKLSRYISVAPLTPSPPPP